MEQGISTFAQGLSTAWALVAIAFLALGIVVYIAVRSRARRVDLETAVQAFHSLDIEAFKNLIDSHEEAFLRDNLPPGKFREVMRQRAWAAFIYTREAGRAAASLALIGQAAQRSADPEIAASGVQLAENAFRLRLQSIGAGFRLLPGTLLPGLHVRPLPSLVERYERSAETLSRLSGFSTRERGPMGSESA
jgi:hypothetical protein